MDDLIFQPLIPGSLWLALASAAAVMLAWYAVRRPGGIPRSSWALMITLMSAVVLLVLGILLNPTWSHQLQSQGGKPIVNILIDGSKSMATPDASGGISRYSAACQSARDISISFGNDYDVEVREFDKSVKAIDAADLASLQPTGGSTDLAAAIEDSLSESRAQGQALILLSDGIHNAGGGSPRVLQAARMAKSLACPIYTQTFGGDVKSIDVGLELKSPQDLAIVGQKLPLTATVTHHGVTSGRTVVTLMLNGKEVDRRDVLLDPKDSSEVHFLISQDKVGVYSYELGVVPFPGQTSLANTTASYVLRIVDQPIRMLVLEGKPYWDSKFFIRTLSDDPAVAMDAVTRISDSRLMLRSLSHRKSSDSTGAPDELVDTWKTISDAKSFLSGADKLRGYQIVVLGRDVDAFLDDAAIANLQSWISQDGGALVCYRGSPTQRPDASLARLFPVDWRAGALERFHVSLTPQGRELNWLTDAPSSDDPLPMLPTLSTVDAVSSSKPLAVVLASSTLPDGTSAPAVVYHPYGAGRVIVVQGAGMWRWAFLPPEYQRQEQIYSSLWQSMMRWLTSGASLKPGQLCSLRADRVRFSTDDDATATLLMREDNGGGKVPMVQLTSGDAAASSPREFSPSPIGEQAGVYRVSFGPLPEGHYMARVAGAKQDDPLTLISFDVRKYDAEEIDLQSRPDLMERIATDSGGNVLASADGGAEVLADFKQSLARTHPVQIEYSPAWDRTWILLGALALWTLSWAIRRSGGLV